MSRTHIGPYRILQPLGRGDGRLFVAYDERLQRRVAPKLIEVDRNPELREQIVKESRALAGIDNGQVVKIYDVVEVRDHMVLIVEYIPGVDLDELMLQQRLESMSAISIVLDLCTALGAAHEAGILHRDIKPSNVLLGVDGRARLTDFGIAALMRDPLPVHTDSAGSYSALSPEQLRGEALDARSDLFQLGILTYRLLSGEHPFGQQNPQAVLDTTQKPLGSLNREVTPALARLVDQLLDKDPRQRPHTALWLRQALLESLQRDVVARDQQLAGLVSQYGRSEQLDPKTARLPRGVSRGARSHILTRKEWIRAVHPLREAWIQLGQIAACVLVLVGSILGVQHWLEHDLVGVHLKRSEVLLYNEDLEIPSGGELGDMLADAVGKHSQIQIDDRDPVELLVLRITCREPVCELSLMRERGEQSRASILRIASGADPALWEKRIRLALDRVYDATDHASNS